MKNPKFILASDSFKGSLTGSQINKILTSACSKVFDNAEIIPFLVADGGEGTLDAIVTNKNGKIIEKSVLDPLFRETKSRYGAFDDCAIIAMNECSGLPMLTLSERNPLKTTTFGLGELILDAVEKGYKNVFVTLGGSATNDGGLGALTALGYKFILKDGSIAKGVGEELINVVKIDGSFAIDLKDVNFTILCDVTNPLIGEKGATRVFSTQKGADSDAVELLEKGMQNWCAIINDYFNADANAVVGGGAAGGLGASLTLFLNAKIKSGINTVLDIIGYKNALQGATAVITGEGRIDSQSVDGKVISGVALPAQKAGVPVIAIVGSVGAGYEKCYDVGVKGVYSIIDKPADLEEILSISPDLYFKTAISVFSTIKAFLK